MVTLLAVYNSEGCVGRCDARCYNASGPDCDCICGGMNHGKGQQKAMDQTREMFEGWLEDYQKKQPFTEVEVPAIYSTATKTAVKIARLLNTEAGYNKVLDVRRDGRHWQVDLKPYPDWKPGAWGEKKTVSYDSLTALRKTLTPKEQVTATPVGAQLSLAL